MPEDSAKYHVFRFKHSHESDYLESNGETVLPPANQINFTDSLIL